MSGLLIDIDGVLTLSWRPIPGAVAAFARLRERGLPIKLITNTTSRSRVWLADTLRGAGFDVAVEDVVTAPVATAAYVAEHYPGAACLVVSSGDIGDDLAGLRLATDNEAPDVVVFGGAGPEFDYDTLTRAFRYVRQGAPLVAMQRNLFWNTDDGLMLDAGAFLAGIEQAAGVEAEVAGKPSGRFFDSALDLLGVSAGEAFMIGDDVENDVLAAQRVGITGVLVRTGKYLPETLSTASGTPDHVIDSFADLPGLLS